MVVMSYITFIIYLLLFVVLQSWVSKTSWTRNSAMEPQCGLKLMISLPLFYIFIKVSQDWAVIKTQRWDRIAQWLKVLAVLADSSSIPSTHMAYNLQLSVTPVQ